MSAALKSSEVQPPHPPSAAMPQRSTRRRLQVLTTPRPPASPIAFPPSSQRDRPLWLKLLMAGQRLSLAVACVSITGALSAYALTVDSNRRLTVATANLGRLQDHQQQLTTANAVFKKHLAETALSAMEDGTLHPKDVLFLEAPEPTPAAPPTNQSGLARCRRITGFFQKVTEPFLSL
jgi:hypothetical protein